MDRGKLVLDGENLILIYEYILAKSIVRELQSHIQLCFEFSTPYLKNTKYGYCLTTIQMAMTMLTDKSETINARVSDGDSDSLDDEMDFQARRDGLSQSIADVWETR